MKIVYILAVLLGGVLGQQYTQQRQNPNRQADRYYNPNYDPYYNPYYQPYYDTYPTPSFTPTIPKINPNPQRQPIEHADKGIAQIFSVIFSCIAMICIMFNKRPIIKRIIKTRSASFINQVSLLSQSAREIGVISLGVINSAEFHSIGEVSIGFILNSFILALCIYYSTKQRRETFSASFIGLTMFGYSFVSGSLNHIFVQAMPYIGSALLIAFRFSTIPKLITTRQIVGTTTYRTLYLGALSLFCRISSFLSVGKMNFGRWLFIGLPFLSVLVMIWVHWRYEVREPERKRVYEEEDERGSEVSFSKKLK